MNGYTIERVLGSGGFGVTYLARDDLGQPFAIKEYFPREFAMRDDQTVLAASDEHIHLFNDCLDRFRREAQALVRLSHAAGGHRGIVRVVTYFTAHGTGFMVMEYVDGATLSSLLRQEVNGLDAARAGSLLTQLLFIVGAVHRAGLLHRDIKPANIILRDDDRVVLIDFGSSRDAASGLTRTFTQIYSSGFAPIEQMVGQRQGPFSDIYAIGAVCYHAIGGKMVDALTRHHAVSSGEPDPLPSAEHIGGTRYPGPFLRSIDAALAINPGQRPASVEAMLAILGQSGDTDGPTVAVGRPEPVQPAVRAKSFRQRGWILLMLPIAIALAGAAWWVGWPDPEARRTGAARQEAPGTEGQVAASQAIERQEVAKREAEKQEAARLEAAKQEADRQEAARQEAARLEAAKQEAAKQEAARQVAARQEAERQEAARQEAARLEAAKQEAAKQEAARQAAARQEAERQEAAKQEAARLEAAKQEAARQEAAQQDDARREAERLQAATQDAERQDTERQQAERLEAAKQEAAKQDAAKQDAVREEMAARDADKATIRAALATLGYYLGSIDKATDAEVTAAIRRRQAFEGNEETGSLPADQRDRLLSDANILNNMLKVPAKSPRGSLSTSARGAQARFDRGWAFETGKGEPKDAAEAAWWYALAAADGMAAAYTNLGTLHARDTDLEAARVLWQTAGALGEGAALFNLGTMAEKGIGAPADPVLARRWYARGATLHHAGCVAALKRLGG